MLQEALSTVDDGNEMDESSSPSSRRMQTFQRQLKQLKQPAAVDTRAAATEIPNTVASVPRVVAEEATLMQVRMQVLPAAVSRPPPPSEPPPPSSGTYVVPSSTKHASLSSAALAETESTHWRGSRGSISALASASGAPSRPNVVPPTVRAPSAEQDNLVHRREIAEAKVYGGKSKSSVMSKATARNTRERRGAGAMINLPRAEPK